MCRLVCAVALAAIVAGCGYTPDSRPASGAGFGPNPEAAGPNVGAMPPHLFMDGLWF